MRRTLLGVLLAATVTGCGGSSSGGTVAAPEPAHSAANECAVVADAGPVVGDALTRTKDAINAHRITQARDALADAASAVETAQRATTGDLTVALGTLNADLQTWRRMIGQHRWAAATDYLDRLSGDVDTVGAICP